MKIAVLLKQVPDTETRIKLGADGKSIDESQIKWIISPYDEFAVEEALRLKEKVGSGEVVVVSAGPARVVEAMRTALAMGADRGIRIDTEGVEMDAYTTAIALAKIVSDEKFDIIFGGKQAIDDDSVQVLQGVSEFVSLPFIFPVDKFEISSDKKTVTVERGFGSGTKHVIETPLPVIIGCDKGLNTPRYASLPGIMKAKSKPVGEKKIAELLDGKRALVSISKMELPPERKAGRVVEGEPAEMVDQLITYLREEAKVI